jgi:hypothetical protein
MTEDGGLKDSIDITITNQVEIPVGLIAHWAMDEGSGTVVADQILGADGTLVGLDPATSWLTGPEGGIQFNGIDSNHIQIPHSPVYDFADEDFTISMLVKYDSLWTNTDRWIMKGTTGGPGSGSRYELYTTDEGHLRFAIDNGPINKKSQLDVPGDLCACGKWVHILATRDTTANILSLYADNVLLGTQEDQSGDISNGEPLRIGESTDESGTAMDGAISDVRIYNVLLNETERTDLFNSYGLTPCAAAKSNDATLSDLQVDGTTVAGFAAATLSYDVELAAGTTTVPTVTATASHDSATVAVTDAASLPGSTTVLVTAEDGTAQTYTINFTVAASPVGINNVTLNNTLVYPNPASDFITLNNTQQASITIHNIVGEIVLDKIVEPGEEINIYELAEGIYIVNVVAGEHVSTLRFVKE